MRLQHADIIAATARHGREPTRPFRQKSISVFSAGRLAKKPTSLRRLWTAHSSQNHRLNPSSALLRQKGRYNEILCASLERDEFYLFDACVASCNPIWPHQSTIFTPPNSSVAQPLYVGFEYIHLQCTALQKSVVDDIPKERELTSLQLYLSTHVVSLHRTIKRQKCRKDAYYD
jgi:hypothetical protein